MLLQLGSGSTFLLLKGEESIHVVIFTLPLWIKELKYKSTVFYTKLRESVEFNKPSSNIHEVTSMVAGVCVPYKCVCKIACAHTHTHTRVHVPARTCLH